MAKDFDLYKLSIHGLNNGNFEWPVVCRRGRAFCVRTEIGDLWLETDSKYSTEFVVISSDQFDDYMRWLDYQLNNSNFFVVVTEVENNLLANTKMGMFEFFYIEYHWNDVQDKWEEVGRNPRIADFPRSLVEKLPDGRLVLPFWVVNKKLPATGYTNLPVVRKLTLLELRNLLQDKVAA